MEDQQAREQQHFNQHHQAIYLAALQQQQLHAQLHAHQQTIMQLQAIAQQNQNPGYNIMASGDYTQESLSNRKLSEIKDILKQMGKKVTGNKEDLIARILGIEEPPNLSLGGSRTPVKKRKSDEIGDDSDEYEENDELGSPKFKRIRIDKNDPVMLECFLCHARDDLVKYKDIKECLKCKHAWKGRRLLKEEACQMFALEPEDLVKLPHKEQASSSNGTPPTPLYAFATAAGAAVKKYGSLYNMIRENPAQRDMLAQYIQQQHMHQQALLQQQILQQQFQSGMIMNPDDIIHHVQQQQQDLQDINSHHIDREHSHMTSDHTGSNHRHLHIDPEREKSEHCHSIHCVDNSGQGGVISTQGERDIHQPQDPHSINVNNHQLLVQGTSQDYNSLSQ